MDPLVYPFHGLFWSAFLVRTLRRRTPPSSSPAAPAQPSRRSRGASVVFLLHGVAFGVLYTGIERAVVERRGERLFALHWSVGALVITAGALLLAASLYVFDSWRLLAQVDAGHLLCTRGPYGRIRHPIYLACDLLALGTYLWLPTRLIGLGALLMVITGDLRARAEERVLRAAFGDEYLRYEASVRRLVPGIY
jgi:protein-S-isoprenylcysteine O-methyltransferase Ste14